MENLQIEARERVFACLQHLRPNLREPHSSLLATMRVPSLLQLTVRAIAPIVADESPSDAEQIEAREQVFACLQHLRPHVAPVRIDNFSVFLRAI